MIINNAKMKIQKGAIVLLFLLSIFDVPVTLAKSGGDIKKEVVEVLRHEILARADLALKQEPQTITMFCQILSDKEHDLWNYKTTGGRCIRNGLGYLFPYIADKSKWPFPKDIMYWENWPVAQPSLVFGAIAFQNLQWLGVWKSLDHFPEVEEVIRNLPVRNPIIWFE